MPSITKIYQQTVKTLLKEKSIFIPFLVFALIEAVVLVLIYLAPRAPFIKVFGPPIARFWGPAYLHYPANFLLLPRLSNHARVVLSVLVWPLTVGTAIALISSSKNAFIRAAKSYVSILIIVFTYTILLHLISKVIITFGAKALPGSFLFVIIFMANLTIQSLFIYAIPILIIEKTKFFKSITKSFSLFKKFFLPTIILVGLPMLIYMPIVMLNYKTPFLIEKFYPELIFHIALLGTIINSLIIDPLVITSITLLYLAQKEKA
jgi:hypothetical protein